MVGDSGWRLQSKRGSVDPFMPEILILTLIGGRTGHAFFTPWMCSVWWQHFGQNDEAMLHNLLLFYDCLVLCLQCAMLLLGDCFDLLINIILFPPPSPLPRNFLWVMQLPVPCSLILGFEKWSAFTGIWAVTCYSVPFSPLCFSDFQVSYSQTGASVVD